VVTVLVTDNYVCSCLLSVSSHRFLEALRFAVQDKRLIVIIRPHFEKKNIKQLSRTRVELLKIEQTLRELRFNSYVFDNVIILILKTIRKEIWNILSLFVTNVCKVQISKPFSRNKCKDSNSNHAQFFLLHLTQHRPL
jgi:hypothetical protein